jgi:hypothetical protein
LPRLIDAKHSVCTSYHCLDNYITDAKCPLLAEDCLLAQFVERLLRRKQPLKSSTPESPIAVIQILNVIGCKVPILLKNSKKMEGCFSAVNQNILNSAQHLACKLTSGSADADRDR